MNKKILRLAVAMGGFSVLGLVSGLLMSAAGTATEMGKLVTMLVITLDGSACGLFVGMVLHPKQRGPKEV